MGHTEDWQEPAVVVRQLTEIGGPSPHVDGHDCYGFSKLPPDELGRECTMFRYSPEPPEGCDVEYDGNAGHWRFIERKS